MPHGLETLSFWWHIHGSCSIPQTVSVNTYLYKYRTSTAPSLKIPQRLQTGFLEFLCVPQCRLFHPSTDFIVDLILKVTLPISHQSCLMTMPNRLLPRPHLLTTVKTDNFYNVCRLHGLFEKVVFNWDLHFISCPVARESSSSRSSYFSNCSASL